MARAAASPRPTRSPTSVGRLYAVPRAACTLDGVDNGRMGVAKNQGRVVEGKIKELVTVDVIQVHAGGRIDIGRERIKPGAGSGISSGKHPLRALEELAGGWVARDVFGDERVYAGRDSRVCSSSVSCLSLPPLSDARDA